MKAAARTSLERWKVCGQNVLSGNEYFAGKIEKKKQNQYEFCPYHMSLKNS